MKTPVKNTETARAGSGDTRNPRAVPTLVKLAGFTTLLAAVFGVTLLVGGQIGPIGQPAAADHGDGTHNESTDGGVGEEDGMDTAAGGHGAHQSGNQNVTAGGAGGVPGGLQVSQDGYTFVLDRSAVAAGTRDLSFRIEGPDGQPLTDYEVEHEKDLHLIAVRRDFTGFQHVHPVRAADGTWSTELDLTGGTWRLFADFAPTAIDDVDTAPLTLGADLAVTGPAGGQSVGDTAASGESRVVVVDGYRVELTGDLAAGEESSLRFAVTRDGAPVTDLQPYLGARGHLVALREGDLAYLHVHPTEGIDATGNEVGFGASVPSIGSYRLYLDFRVEDVVRTASFALTTADTAAADDAESEDADVDSSDQTEDDLTEDDHSH